MTSPSAAAEQAAAEEKAAVLAGVACYFFWGFLPLLFRFVAWTGPGAWEIFAWRTVWSLVAAAALVGVSRRWRDALAVLRRPRTLAWLALSATLVGFNWAVFIWAVANGHTLDASFGYYLNPLLSVAAGLVLFKERLDRGGWIAIALAVVGVGVQTVALGHLPLISLALAASFCLYGVIRKHVTAEAQAGLLVECLVLAGPGLAYGLWLQSTGAGHAAQPLSMAAMALTGPATVAPLVTFTWAARRMPLSTMGFLQFIGPTMQLIIAVLSGERLSPLGLLAFAFIWSGVAVYAFTAWRKMRRVSLTRPA